MDRRGSEGITISPWDWQQIERIHPWTAVSWALPLNSWIPRRGISWLSTIEGLPRALARIHSTCGNGWYWCPVVRRGDVYADCWSSRQTPAVADFFPLSSPLRVTLRRRSAPPNSPSSASSKIESPGSTPFATAPSKFSLASESTQNPSERPHCSRWHASSPASVQIFAEKV